MARIRTVKPDCWKDAAMRRLSRDARLLFIGMITQADDDGRLVAEPRIVRAEVFPWDDLTDDQVQSWLAECHQSGVAVVYEIDGIQYAWLPGFTRNQIIRKPVASKLPVPPENPMPMRGPYQCITSDVPVRTEGKGKEGSGGEGKERIRAREIPDSPSTLDDLERCWPTYRCRESDRPRRETAIWEVRSDLPTDVVDHARRYVSAHGFTNDQIDGCPGLHRWLTERRWLEPLPKAKRNASTQLDPSTDIGFTVEVDAA